MEYIVICVVMSGMHHSVAAASAVHINSSLSSNYVQCPTTEDVNLQNAQTLMSNNPICLGWDNIACLCRTAV